jgi:hypothetical protein
MVFQASHNEAARVANDIASQLQREETFKKTLADRMSEDDKTVRNVPKSEALRTEEREERQRQSAGQSNRNNEGEDDDAGEQPEGATFADGRMDFMA